MSQDQFNALPKKIKNHPSVVAAIKNLNLSVTKALIANGSMPQENDLMAMRAIQPWLLLPKIVMQML